MQHSKLFLRARTLWALVFSATLLVACGGGDPKLNIPLLGGGGGGGGTVQYTVSGSVTGMESGNPLKLLVNGVAEVSVPHDGSYSYTVSLPVGTIPAGTTYTVAVKAQPFWQWCSIANGSGVVTTNVGNIAVSCVAAAAKVETVPGSTTNFGYPLGIVGDNQGHMYVSDAMFANNIREINSDGSVSVLAGPPVGTSPSSGYVDGAGSSARFNNPNGLALDQSGHLLVVDNNTMVRSISPLDSATAQVSTLAGNWQSHLNVDGSAADARFGWIFQLTVNPQGDVLVADNGNDSIRKISQHNGSWTVSTVARLPQYSGPSGISADPFGNTWFTLNYANTLNKLDSSGTVTAVVGSGVTGFADGTGTAASFNAPTSISTDAVGNVYVADSGNYAIRRVTPAGAVSTLAGSGTSGLVDGIGKSAQFAYPNSIFIDQQGVIWVTDTGFADAYAASPSALRQRRVFTMMQPTVSIRKITPVDPATVSSPS